MAQIIDYLIRFNPCYCRCQCHYHCFPHFPVTINTIITIAITMTVVDATITMTVVDVIITRTLVDAILTNINV